MSLRRMITILGATVVATGSLVAAAPAKKKPAKPAPVAPAKDTGGAGGTGSGATTAGGSGDAAGSAVQPIEDTPPSDMNGVDENPDNPHAMTNQEPKAAVAPVAKKTTGYPIQEVLRPITLPQNMSEVSIAPHMQVSPLFASD